MNPQLHRLALVLAGGFVAIALTSGYWGLLRQAELLARPDNPRRILVEQRQPRGAILDRDGAVLAESVGTPGEYARHYPYPNLAPVLGYVSPFYGLAGIEAVEDAVLHGDAGREAWETYWQELVGQPIRGQAVRLTIDLPLQRAADEALAAETGAILVLNADTGEILALASHPTFDPNQLEDHWQTLTDDPRAPLLNRALFALYQPGGALQPALLAAALDGRMIDLQASFATAPVAFESLTLTCRESPTRASLSLAEALQLGCPSLSVDLGQRLGDSGLDRLFADLRLTRAPALGLPTLATPLTETISNLSLSALGQDALTVTPLHVALFTAALARSGEMPAPHVIQAHETVDGQWEPVVPGDHPVAVFTAEAAQAVSALMPQGHSALAYTGPGEDRTTLAWFSGFAPQADPQYVVVVLLEGGQVEQAQIIGQALLQTASGGAINHASTDLTLQD